MFNDRYRYHLNVAAYDRDQFCLHLMQIHAAGKMGQFVDGLPMGVLESLESCMPEWSKLGGSGTATSWASDFLNKTLYREAVDTFKRAASEVKPRVALEISRLACELAAVNADSLERLKEALDGLNEGENDYSSKVDMGAFLRDLTPDEKKALKNSLGAVTMEQVKQAMGGTTVEHRFQFRALLECMTDEKIRKNVDAQTAEVLVRIRQQVNSRITNDYSSGTGSGGDAGKPGQSTLAKYCAEHDWHAIPKGGLDAVAEALDSPTVDNLEAMKQVLGDPAAAKLEELEEFLTPGRTI